LNRIGIVLKKDMTVSIHTNFKGASALPWGRAKCHAASYLGTRLVDSWPSEKKEKKERKKEGWQDKSE